MIKFLRRFYYSLFVVLAMGFLFINQKPLFIKSEFLFYALSGIAMVIILTFFQMYKKSFTDLVSKQLYSMQKVSSHSWINWISENVKEFTSIFLAASPYLIGFCSFSNGLVLWFGFLSFLPVVSLFAMILYTSFMTFLMILIVHNWLFNRHKQDSFPVSE